MTKRLLAAAAVTAALASPAQAAELIVGVKAGIVDYEASGFDPITVASGQLGYEFIDLVAVDVAAEVEVTQSLNSADGPGGEYDYQSAGLYLSARTLGPVYVIGRAGMIKADIKRDNGADIDDSGSVLSLGLGFSTGLRWELEMSTYDFKDSDVTMVTLGLSF